MASEEIVKAVNFLRTCAALREFEHTGPAQAALLDAIDRASADKDAEIGKLTIDRNGWRATAEARLRKIEEFGARIEAARKGGMDV